MFLMREEEPNLMHSCWICTASSRVGARTSTMGPSPLSALAIVSQAASGSSSGVGTARDVSRMRVQSSPTARVEGPHLGRAAR